MADLTIEAYGALTYNGNYPVQDQFLGKVTISTLSSSSQSVALPAGTVYVKLYSDAAVPVFYAFGAGAATAATTSQELGQAERLYTGLNGSANDTVAARIA